MKSSFSDDKDRGLLANDRTPIQSYDQLMDQVLVLASRNQRVQGRDLMLQNKSVMQAALNSIDAHGVADRNHAGSFCERARCRKLQWRSQAGIEAPCRSASEGSFRDADRAAGAAAVGSGIALA